MWYNNRISCPSLGEAVTVRVHRRFAVALSLLLLAGGASVALAQGYSGLIPDASSDAPQQKGDDGYSGLIAPTTPAPAFQAPEVIPQPVRKQTKKQPAAAAAQKPPVAENPNVAIMPSGAVNITPIKRPAEMTPIPSAPESYPIVSVEQLRNLAMMMGVEIKRTEIPPEMAKMIKLPPATYSFISGPRARIEGMLPMEYMVKSKVDMYMKSITDPATPAPQRREIAKDAYDILLNLKDGLTTKKNLPDKLYEAMGAPVVYVQEEKEGVDRGLARLDAALKVMKGYQ